MVALHTFCLLISLAIGYDHQSREQVLEADPFLSPSHSPVQSLQRGGEWSREERNGGMRGGEKRREEKGEEGVEGEETIDRRVGGVGRNSIHSDIIHQTISLLQISL